MARRLDQTKKRGINGLNIRLKVVYVPVYIARPLHSLTRPQRPQLGQVTRVHCLAHCFFL